MSVLGLIQMGLLAWLLFMVLGSLATAAAHPWLRAKLSAVAPDSRGAVLRGLCVLPVLGGLVLTLLCFVPAAIGTVFPGFDHCPHHGIGHLHFCMTHLPHTAGSLTGWLLISSFGLLFLVPMGARFRQCSASHRLLRQLAHTARFDARYNAWLVDSDEPVAMTTGIVHKRTLLSTGLVRALSSKMIRTIVAHEHAHEKRNDAFWKTVTAVLSLVHLPRTRRALLGELEFACEQACDEEAAIELGDRVCVAQALIAVERLRHHSPQLSLVGVSFGVHGLRGRIESLVASRQKSTWSPRLVRALALAAGLVLLLVADHLHHVTETVVGLISG